MTSRDFAKKKKKKSRRVTFALAVVTVVWFVRDLFQPRVHGADTWRCDSIRGATVDFDSPAGASRRRKLADGCHHVFLDVGANLGVHTRFLLEPSKYGHAHRARDFFSRKFGPERSRDPRDFCAFSFEPNPAHARRHRDLTAAYFQQGWRYRPIGAGVGATPGKMRFYHTNNTAADVGFSTNKRKCLGRDTTCVEEEVPVVRLAEWIEHEVMGRELPDRPPKGRYGNRGPTVVMKMDIEGMEWVVLPDLVASGVLCRTVDAVMTELHLTPAKIFPQTFPDHGGWTVENETQAWVLGEQIIGVVNRSPNCKTAIELIDDESYYLDGVPFP